MMDAEPTAEHPAAVMVTLYPVSAVGVIVITEVVSPVLHT